MYNRETIQNVISTWEGDYFFSTILQIPLHFFPWTLLFPWPLLLQPATWPAAVPRHKEILVTKKFGPVTFTPDKALWWGHHKNRGSPSWAPPSATMSGGPLISVMHSYYGFTRQEMLALKWMLANTKIRSSMFCWLPAATSWLLTFLNMFSIGK